MFTAALFTVAKIWKQHKYPSKDEWIKKMEFVYINKILLSYIKGKPAICNNMYEPGRLYAK